MNFLMKLMTVYILFFMSELYTQIIQRNSHIDAHESVVALVIMIKDEAHVIVPTLQPLVDAGIDSILVYDTGSTDGTQQVVEAYFKDHNLTHAYLVEDPFIDFATSLAAIIIIVIAVRPTT